MQRIRLLISLAALVTTITLGLSWNTDMVLAEAGTPECNCIDGHTNKDGYYGWDPDQERMRCLRGCIITTD